MDGRTRLKSDLASRGKDLSDLLQLKRADPRMMELREIKANRASLEHLESSSSSSLASGKLKARDLKANPLLHKIQDKQLSVSQQTLTNVSGRPFICFRTANDHFIHSRLVTRQRSARAGRPKSGPRTRRRARRSGTGKRSSAAPAPTFP